jgi:flagellar basal-body rod protein FlgF
VPEDGAFLAVEGPGGEILYTRDGRLGVDGERRLTAGGLAALDPGGSPIVLPPGAPVEVGPDGVVRAGGVDVARLGLARLEGPVDRVGPSLLAPGAGGVAAPVDHGRLRTGELELGNASALEATVDLISAQRSFDASMQALQTYRRMDERSNEVGRVR